jgi:SH3-like domain-containing protein
MDSPPPSSNYSTPESNLYSAPDTTNSGGTTVGASGGDLLITSTDMNLREGPSVDTAKITVISEQSVVTTLEPCVDGWCKISYNSYSGYLSQKYLR